MIYKLLKKPFFGKFMVKWRNPLTEEEQKGWERFAVKSQSGSLIQGMFAKTTQKQIKGTIVLGHPMGKEAKGYFLKRNYTNLLRENGFNTVVFDINGFGESGHGNFSFFEDIIAVSKKTKELFPNLPIGYHGISLGAMYSTIAFADVSHQFDFAIVESSSTTLAEFWVQFPMAYKVLKTISTVMPKYEKKIAFKDRIKEVKHLQSILFIYSEKDSWVPVHMGRILQENANVPTEFWLAKDAEHAEVMKSTDKEAYQERILKFFNQEVIKYRDLN
jgi:alpha-beta hydrolase superfamily lysophospholipase